MSPRSKIQDAGEKLGGARKDASVTGDPQSPSTKANLLEQLWPKPARWVDLIADLGAQRAAMCMVVYENLANCPHVDGWLGLSAQQWRDFYNVAVRLIRELLTSSGDADYAAISKAYTARMTAHGLKVCGSDKMAKACVYAVGKAHRRTTNHPFSLTPINNLRVKYLPFWGWGTDDRVSDRLSMGALHLRSKETGENYWRAVKGAAGVWEYLESTTFETEQEALACTGGFVEILLSQDKTVPGRTKAPTWVRPFLPEDDIRAGFATSNADGKSEIDLLDTFGFRGIEFGNWVTQEQRQWFVNAAYDAFMDLTQLLGVHATFASLNGVLGLAYGSRGEGLSRAAAHFEPGRWVLHLTKESGPGAIAHEFGHAWDCWMADQLWGQRRRLTEKRNNYRRGALFEDYPEFMSEQRNWSGVQRSEMEAPFRDWRDRTHAHGGDAKWRWVRDSEVMDARRKYYWSQAREMFARGFEVLVLDSLGARGRHNDMLVFGVTEADGQSQKDKGEPFPYPLGAERAETCRLMAAILRTCKTQLLAKPA